MNGQKDLRFFKVILSSIADGVFTVDSERIITSFNPAAEKITGVPASNAIGKRCFEVFHSDICEHGCLLKQTMITGDVAIDQPVNIINSSGDKIPISISTAALRDDNGDVLGAVETFRDLSTIEHLRKELKKNYSFEDIISKSPAIHKLFSILPDIAESESTVLIQGPSGSGKESRRVIPGSISSIAISNPRICSSTHKAISRSFFTFTLLYCLHKARSVNANNKVMDVKVQISSGSKSAS